MQYEFYLTDDCNRSCKFCKIPKKKFYATQNQAEEFYKIVQKEQEGKLDKYDLLFFGGEPLLNITVLKHLVNLFKDDNRCIMHLTTNADFLDEFLDTKELTRIDKVILSAYDIFKEDVDKMMKHYHYALESEEPYKEKNNRKTTILKYKLNLC